MKSDVTVDVLERALARERKARDIAESLLEQRSQELYLSSIEITNQFESAKQRLAQLEFLNQYTQILMRTDSLDAIIGNAMRLLQEQCGAKDFIALLYDQSLDILTIEDFEIADDEFNPYATLYHWHDCPCDLLGYSGEDSKIFCIKQSDLSEHLVENLNFRENQELLVISLPYREKKRALMVFYLEVKFDQIGMDFQTVQTAATQLRSGINRLLAQMQNQHSIERLETSVNELNNAKERLINQEQLVAIGQLSAGIAHEINNPIGYMLSNIDSIDEYSKALLNYLNILEEKLRQSDDTISDQLSLWRDEHEVDFIIHDFPAVLKANNDGLNRVKDIAMSLKSFARKGDSAMQEVNINEPIEGALLMCWSTIKYQCDVVKDLSAIVSISGDSGQLQQVFLNLMVNAIHAMPNGGTLTLKSWQDDSHVHVSITDTGIGMDSVTQQRVFSPFFTTKGPGEGSGLGLSVSLGILQGHHAEIALKSELEKGTSFTLSFPIA